MALLFILLLNAAVGAASAGSHLVPEQCLQGPEFWCKDVATAIECRRELYCWSLQNNSLLWGSFSEEEAAASATPGPGKKCSMCIKIMQKLQELAGEDPDDEAIDIAISQTCKVLGKPLSWVCKTLLKKFKDKIVEAMENNEDPNEICVDLGMCRSDLKILPGFAFNAAA